jgi:hypothetical protein
MAGRWQRRGDNKVRVEGIGVVVPTRPKEKKVRKGRERGEQQQLAWPGKEKGKTLTLTSPPNSTNNGRET